MAETETGIYYPSTGDPERPALDMQKLAESIAAQQWSSKQLKPTVGLVSASADLTLTTSYQDVPGATLEISPAVASSLKVTAIFRFMQHENGTARGTVQVDGVDQEGSAILTPYSGSTVMEATVSQVYLLPLTAAVHTIKLRARREAAEGQCFKQGSRFLYELIAST